MVVMRKTTSGRRGARETRRLELGPLKDLLPSFDGRYVVIIIWCPKSGETRRLDAGTVSVKATRRQGRQGTGAYFANIDQMTARYLDWQARQVPYLSKCRICQSDKAIMIRQASLPCRLALAQGTWKVLRLAGKAGANLGTLRDKGTESPSL